MSSNCLIGFPNRIDTSSLSGGSYAASLPITNLQNRIIGKVARTSDALLTSSIINIDLVSDKTVKVISVANHNLSLSALYRIRGSDVSDFSTNLVDTGWVVVWPAIYPSDTLDWEDSTYFTGQPTEDDLTGYTTNLIVVLDENTRARYWRIEFDDTTNSAGYIQYGRIFIGPVWEPLRGPEAGLQMGWETATTLQTALSGTQYFQRRTPSRYVRFSLDTLTVDESLAKAFEMDRLAGIDLEVLWIQDSTDTTHALRRRWLGTLRNLSPIESPYSTYNKKAYEIKEQI